MVSPIFTFFTFLLWRAEKMFFLYKNCGGHLTILLRKNFQEGSSFFLLFPFSSIQSKHFLRTKRPFCFVLSRFFSEKIFRFFFPKRFRKKSLSWKTFSFFFHQIVEKKKIEKKGEREEWEEWAIGKGDRKQYHRKEEKKNRYNGKKYERQRKSFEENTKKEKRKRKR